MQLMIEPQDVWLFRDGRPFDAGSDHRAQSLFPPPPTVMQGALRDYQLVRKGVDRRDRQAVQRAVGTDSDYGGLRLRGPLPCLTEGEGIQRLFPVPADVQVLKDGTGRTGALRTRPLRPSALPSGMASSAAAHLPQLLFAEGKPQKEGPGRWVREGDLIQALTGEGATVLEDSDLFVRDPRVGVRIDPATGSVVSEMLYEAEFVQPKSEVGLWVEVTGFDDWPNQGAMRIGGEGRTAIFQRLGPESEMPWPGEIGRDLPSRFRLYFASPAYFTHGWLPESWTRFIQGDVNLEAAAVTGYDTLGGYDMLAGQQRPSRRFVPAGSVYYFSTSGAARIRPDLDNRAVTEWGGEIGFGQVVITRWRE